MAMTKAEIHIRGFLGSDPEFFTAATGKQFYRASVAVKTGEKQTTWFPLLFGEKWNLENWKKGDLVDIEGNFSANKYVDKEGIERLSFTVFPRNAFNITLAERAREMKQAELAEGEEFTTDFEEDFEDISIS